MRIILSLIIMVGAFSFNSCREPIKKQAYHYNDSLINIQKEVVISLNQLDSSFQTAKLVRIDSCYNQAANQVLKAKEKINKMPDFEGKNDLKNYTLSLLDSYNSVLTKEYKEIINIYKCSRKGFNYVEEQKLNMLSEEIYVQLNTALESYRAKQKEFAIKYNFSLEEAPEISEEI